MSQMSSRSLKVKQPMGTWTSVTRPSALSVSPKSTAVTHGFLGTFCKLVSFIQPLGNKGQDLQSHQKHRCLRILAAAGKASHIHLSSFLPSFLAWLSVLMHPSEKNTFYCLSTILFSPLVLSKNLTRSAIIDFFFQDIWVISKNKKKSNKNQIK